MAVICDAGGFKNCKKFVVEKAATKTVCNTEEKQQG